MLSDHAAPQNELALDDPDSRLRSKRLGVIHARAVEAGQFDRDLMFDGFQRFRATTFSWSANLVLALATKYPFESFECVFGAGRAISRSGEALIAFQHETAAAINRALLGKTMTPERQQRLIALRNEGRFKLLVVNGAISHAKIYLLEREHRPPYRRVIVGSANMSEVAFSGRQAETVIVFDDDEAAWDHYSAQYAAIRATAALEYEPSRRTDELVASEVHIVPVAVAAEKAKKHGKPVTVFVPKALADEQLSDDFVERVHKRTAVLAKGDLGITETKGSARLPFNIRSTLRRPVYTGPGEEESAARFQRVRDWFELSGEPYPRDADDEDVRADVARWLRFFSNYENGFQGDVGKLQRDYFALMGWLYHSPLNCDVRRMADRAGIDRNMHPRFAIVYGASNCGKSTLVETLMVSMFGFTGVVDAGWSTPSQMVSLANARKRLPLVYDDIDRKRLDEAGSRVIKSDYPGNWELPCMVFSANAEAKAFKDEIRKRTLMVYTDTSLPGDQKRLQGEQHRTVVEIRNNMTQALYTRFLQDYARRIWDDDQEPVEDSLRLSTEILADLFDRYLPRGARLPDWCNPVGLYDHQDAVWNSVRQKMDTLLNPNTLKKSGALADYEWSVSHDRITIRLPTFDRRGVLADIPGWVVDNGRTTGSNVVMLLDEVEKFVGHRVIDRGNFLSRLFSRRP